MKKLRRINYIVLTLLSCIPVLAKQYIANAEGILNTNNTTTNSVWAQDNMSVPFSEKHDDKFESNQIYRSNAISAAGPDLTFNVDPSVVNVKRNPDGTINYYAICRNNPDDTTAVQFTIYPNKFDAQYEYSIDWGDESAEFFGKLTSPYTISHDFKNCIDGEFWAIKYRIVYLGQTYESTYNLYVGSSPTLNLNTPNNIQLCTEEVFEYPLNTIKNSKDTKYKIQFNDGTKPEEFDTLPPSIKHAFKATSCGVNTVIGSTPKPNSYGMTITAENYCGISTFSFGGIYVSEGPNVQLQKQPYKACVNGTVIFDGKVIKGKSPNSFSTILNDCYESGNYIWEIRDVNGNLINSDNAVLQLVKGDFGSNNGYPNNYIRWTTATPKIETKFLVPGTYTVKLMAANSCGVSDTIQKIYIDPYIDPTFTSEANISCNSLNLKLTNSTNISDLNKQALILKQQTGVDVQKFKWDIYRDGNLIETIEQTYTNGIFVPVNIQKSYTTSGKYKVVLTYLGNTCNINYEQRTFDVPGNTKIEIKPMNACLIGDSVNVNASAQIETYGLKIDQYHWKITDDKNVVKHESFIEFPMFTFKESGKYNVNLAITTSCGTTSVNSSFIIEPEPTIKAISDITICENEIFPVVSFEVNNATQGIRWENDNKTIGLDSAGVASAGNEKLPSFIALNTGNDTVFAKITVYPLNVGCNGKPIVFKIIVLPSKVTIQPDSTITICSGEAIDSLRVYYNGIGNNPIATYQWYSYTDSDPIPTTVSSGTLSTIKPTGLETTYYFCKATSLSGCKLQYSDTVKVNVNTTPVIHDYNLKILSGSTFKLYPENGEVLNGFTNVVPDSTKYTWIIDSINPLGSIIGGTNDTIPQDTIIQTLTNITKGNTIITYKVVPFTPTCIGDTFNVIVAVVPPINAKIDSLNIRCFGENNGQIMVRNIVGIIGNQNPVVSCLRLLDNISFTPTVISSDSAIFTGLSSGRYEITINDSQSLGIPFIDSVDIFEPEVIDLRLFSKKNVTCYGINDGEINLTIQPRIIGSNEYTYSWNFSTDSISWRPITSNIHDPLKLRSIGRGYYYLKITDGNGCTDSTSVVRITEPMPFYFNADVFDANDCDNMYSGSISNLSFGGGTVLTNDDYKFSLRFNTNYYPNLNITDLKSHLSGLQEGTYEITMTDSYNCNTLVKQYIIKRPDPLEVIINSALNFDCSKNLITQVSNAIVTGGIPLVDNAGRTYYNIEWKIGDAVIGTGDTLISAKSGELINVVITDKRGCQFTGNVSFISKIPELSWKDSLIDCNTHKYRFTAVVKNDLTQNYTYKWKFGNDQKVTSGPSLDYFFPNEGNYIVQLVISRKDGLCEFPLSKLILVESAPNLIITEVNGGTWDEIKKEVRFCKGESVRVRIDGANSYYWSVDGSTSNFVTITEQGDYFVEGKSASGCSSLIEFKALNNIYNYSIITDKDNPAKNNEVLLNYKNTAVTFWTQFVAGSSYSWDFGDGSSLDLGFKKLHTFNVTSNNYYDILLQVINPDGCKEEATKRIWVEVDNLPNTITPNGDGINDVFMAGWKIQVFNRNGLLLFDGTGGWDGTYDGKPVSSDTYFYILTYSSTESAKTKAGYITVIR